MRLRGNTQRLYGVPSADTQCSLEVILNIIAELTNQSLDGVMSGSHFMMMLFTG